MVSVRRILRDYRDAGSVNSLLALWGFVDESTFLTKAGHVGVVYRLRGVDYEGLSHSQRQALVLVELLGMSAEEAGRVLRIEPVSVRVRLSRARTLLRQRATDGD